MNRRRTFRAAAMIVAGLSCALVAGDLGGPPRPVQAPPAETRAPAAGSRAGEYPSSSERPRFAPHQRSQRSCTLGERLVPRCGVLWGVAPDAHTGSARAAALATFEARTGRRQDIYHAYHRGRALFPSAEDRAIAADGRLLFLNWRPMRWSWAGIADGAADSYLDQLARHINDTFDSPFFLTIHHEPEDDVRQQPGSGHRASDYVAMYRHVVKRLRARGVGNLVTVMTYMSYVPWNTRSWFADLYPGNDVVDWIAWDAYTYSDPGYGHGDFAEMVNRRSSRYPTWPGFYNWAAKQFPNKPLMLAEWAVWHSPRSPGHMATFYESVGAQIGLFPRLKAMVHFDTPADKRGRDSRPTATRSGLAAYRELGSRWPFQVELGLSAR